MGTTENTRNTATQTITGFLRDRIAEDEVDADLFRWSSVRVLAECEAKRRIVDLHHDPEAYAPTNDPSCACTDYPESSADCETLRALASVYASHPDYRDEWRA